jgi:hypothetical protein
MSRLDPGMTSTNHDTIKITCLLSVDHTGQQSRPMSFLQKQESGKRIGFLVKHGMAKT